MNDVLDLKAMTNGEFRLSPKPTEFTTAVLDILRRCRKYLPADTGFQYTLPARDIVLNIDMFRVSQILSNAIRYVIVHHHFV